MIMRAQETIITRIQEIRVTIIIVNVKVKETDNIYLISL
jgi:uncharacterized protein YfkK (UPF0435 family)